MIVERGREGKRKRDVSRRPASILNHLFIQRDFTWARSVRHILRVLRASVVNDVYRTINFVTVLPALRI
ncbi:hypothetical protein Barb4_00480 [Bacteroidales bacterium Barb4]|nr:hypothetical protein Barb4_00480 [Bacteroidales bacterium Barb4]